MSTVPRQFPWTLGRAEHSTNPVVSNVGCMAESPKELKKTKYYCLVSTPKDKVIDLERALSFVNAPLVSLPSWRRTTGLAVLSREMPSGHELPGRLWGIAP